MASNKTFQREQEDVGNVQLLEHVNLTVPDPTIASLFYVTGLGLTRDPYMDFGTRNMWVNMGDQQFHLPTRTAQVLRGRIGVVVPDLGELKARFQFAEKGLAETAFQLVDQGEHVDLTCPYGNHIRVHAPGTVSAMDLGLAYVQFDIPVGKSGAIGRFYQDVLGCPVSVEQSQCTVSMGHNQQLIFSETNNDVPAYDGHHIAIYVANFSGPHRWLSARGLISEESDQYQYRFERIVDPQNDELAFEIEHEVRSLSHPMYRRPLLNRNAASNFFTYRKHNEHYRSPETS